LYEIVEIFFKLDQCELPLNSSLLELVCNAKGRECNYIKTASLLVNHLSKEGLNLKDHKGFTLLILAAQQGNYEMVDMLLRANADTVINQEMFYVFVENEEIRNQCIKIYNQYKREMAGPITEQIMSAILSMNKDCARMISNYAV
jgi:ankyrin repeat protein